MTAAAPPPPATANNNNSSLMGGHGPGHGHGHGHGSFGDTTYTKVFVGGLAWETHKDTMKSYFEQFGEILEAVVITDKATGRSKGYGFVTFKEAEAAMRACLDASPMIDGRRANCNLASLGVQRSKPSTPKHGGGGGGGRSLRATTGFHAAAGGVGYAASPTFPPYAIHQGFPYNLYGYSSYSPADYTYPTSYYGVYGGAAAQFSVYGTGPNGLMSSAAAAAAFYPYLHLAASSAGGGEGSSGAPAYTSGQTYGVQYPSHHHQHHGLSLFHYSGLNSTAGYPAHHFGAPMSLAPTPALQSGVTMALHAPPIPHR